MTPLLSYGHLKLLLVICYNYYYVDIIFTTARYFVYPCTVLSVPRTSCVYCGIPFRFGLQHLLDLVYNA